MEFRWLGRTGIKVSSLALGTMPFGAEADEAASAAMFRAARESGVNFFDCADVYAGGRAEEILGRLIKDVREEVVITSKAYFQAGPEVNAMGASRRHLLFSVEKSLRRLATERIDVYFVHRFDERTPLEETLRALDDLVRQGKILYTGASNFAAWQVEKALGVAAKAGCTPFHVVQPMYSLVKRQAEVEILPMAQAESLGVMTYSPLAGGGSGDRAEISALSSGVMGTSTEAIELRSCSTFRAPRMGAVTAGWPATQATARLAGS